MKHKDKVLAAVLLLAALIGLGAVLFTDGSQQVNPDPRKAQGAYKPDIRPGAP